MFHYVYQLSSITDPSRHYTGLTRDLKRRIKQHNQGEVQATANHIPWQGEVANFLDRTVKPAHEYRCNPERLFTKITFRRNNVELGAALTEVTKQLKITWKVEAGRIVFEDSPASKNGSANKP